MILPSWTRRAVARIEGATSGYFQQVGWFQSRALRKAVDARGEPMPWFTYPAARFLSDRIRPELRVLEFGSGMGTLWWSQRVREVVAIEHHAGWADHVASRCKARIVRANATDAEAYAQAAFEGAPFDVIIVDGIFRQECMAIAPELLGHGGIVILDDAQRDEYRPAIDALLQSGFRQLEFHGPQPVSKHAGCTAIFYRDVNVLGL